MLSVLTRDESFHKMHSDELVGGLPTGQPSDYNGFELILVVDTSEWIVWLKGIWYVQA